MGGPGQGVDGEGNFVKPPSHAWTCRCGKRIIAFLNAVWPGETWRIEESKFNAAVAAHQMECSDGQ